MKHQLSTMWRSASDSKGALNRRHFLGGPLTVAASASSLATFSSLGAESIPPKSKPVVVDVPGCRQIEVVAKEATRKQRCFLVDYKIPTDPANLEVFKRLREPGFGAIAQVATVGIGGGRTDQPKTATIESRLQRPFWLNDVALGGDIVVNYDIHTIDAAICHASATHAFS